MEKEDNAQLYILLQALVSFILQKQLYKLLLFTFQRMLLKSLHI